VALPSAAQSVGGLLAAAVGRIPQPGDRIVIGALEFDVIRASATRVERLLVRRAGTVAITAGGL
jgi:Mg2+/Co2+ transporter CorC